MSDRMTLDVFDPPVPSLSDAKWRALRERLALALCAGHLDLPDQHTHDGLPEGVAEYLARVAGRLARVLLEEDEVVDDVETCPSCQSSEGIQMVPKGSGDAYCSYCGAAWPAVSADEGPVELD